MRLENTERMRMENRGSRYTLIIRDVVEADLITYTCQADNSQGKTKKDIVLSEENAYSYSFRRRNRFKEELLCGLRAELVALIFSTAVCATLASLAAFNAVSSCSSFYEHSLQMRYPLIAIRLNAMDKSEKKNGSNTWGGWYQAGPLLHVATSLWPILVVSRTLEYSILFAWRYAALFVKGMPHPMQFRSQKSSEEKDSFNISWSVISYSPIESYRLYYRKADGGEQLYSSPPTRKTPKKVSTYKYMLIAHQLERLDINQFPIRATKGANT
ncbi:unnamed protein product [Nezara viridula]|uniref:Immunoglobulin I-set domain-containing protein n=1 Tax=Nezara viridula TaxID=85310 RepID=A0A9P0H771_NEZVI|nr:unnamed protein product [Nezara viridula]